MLYVSSTQISAILPSSVPVGAASLTVSYNNQTSPPAAFEVMSSSFGAYSTNGQGNGFSVVTNAQYQLFGPTTAALAGDVVTLWGTGPGPASGDEAAGPLPGNPGSTPVQVRVGSQPATVLYSGRSGCCAGLDQIAFMIPPEVAGCSAPINVRTGNIVSNTGYLPIGSESRTCEEPDIPETSGLLQQWMQQGTLSYGDILLTHSMLLGSAITPSTVDSEFADFPSFSYQPDSGVPDILPPTGTCYVSPFYPGNAISPSEPVKLDAGAALTLSGVAGTESIPLSIHGGYSLQNSSQHLAPGAYTVASAGGTAVGPFTAALSIPQTFTWTNGSSAQTITESAGQSITWSGADASGTINIRGDNFAPGFRTGASFSCTAAPGDGQFTIPPYILLRPAHNSDHRGRLVLRKPVDRREDNVSSFTAPGLAFGYVIAIYSMGTNTVTYE